MPLRQMLHIAHKQIFRDGRYETVTLEEMPSRLSDNLAAFGAKESRHPTGPNRCQLRLGLATRTANANQDAAVGWPAFEHSEK